MCKIILAIFCLMESRLDRRKKSPVHPCSLYISTYIKIQTLSIRPLFKTSPPYLSCLSSLCERGPHLGRSDLAGQLYSTRATFQIIKVPRDLPTAIKAWIMEVGSLQRQDEEKFFFLFLWIPRHGSRCDDDQAQSCIVCNPLIRVECFWSKCRSKEMIL